MRTRWKDKTFFIIDCVLQRRWAKALPVFAKHNRLSCVACSAGCHENRECFSNGVKSTAYIRCSYTVYDFFTLGRIREQVVLLISCWYDDAIAAFHHITSLSISLKFYHLSSTLLLSIYKFDPYPLVQDDLQRRVLLRGAYGLSLRSLSGHHLLRVTASPWTIEASTRERWQFGALTNRKATSSTRAPSTSSLCYYYVALSLYRDKWTTIIRLWWLSQWLVTYGHHLAVTIYLHVTPSSGRHTSLQWKVSHPLHFHVHGRISS